MSLVVDFPHAPPPVEARPVSPTCCPLCGDRFRLGVIDQGTCYLGHCAAGDAPYIARNREILRHDLFLVEVELLAIEAAITSARARAVPIDTYLDERFALVIRRRILRGYVE